MLASAYLAGVVARGNAELYSAPEHKLYHRRCGYHCSHWAGGGMLHADRTADGRLPVA